MSRFHLTGLLIVLLTVFAVPATPAPNTEVNRFDFMDNALATVGTQQGWG